MELWIARDNDDMGELFLYTEEPFLMENGKLYNCDGEHYGLPNNLFPEITFENSPKKVLLKIIE